MNELSDVDEFDIADLGKVKEVTRGMPVGALQESSIPPTSWPE